MSDESMTPNETPPPIADCDVEDYVDPRDIPPHQRRMANEISKLKAENARLRSALQPFADKYEKHKHNNDGCLCPAYISMMEVCTAAEAIKPGSTANEQSALGMMNLRAAAALQRGGEGGEK